MPFCTMSSRPQCRLLAVLAVLLVVLSLVLDERLAVASDLPSHGAVASSKDANLNPSKTSLVAQSIGQVSQDVPLIGASSAVLDAPSAKGSLAIAPLGLLRSIAPFTAEMAPGRIEADGLIYVITDDGQVQLVNAGQSPFADREAADSADSYEPAALVVPPFVEHDGITYAVTSIGPRAFSGCSCSLVTLSASVATVDELAFCDSSVGSVEVADGSEHFASYDGVLYDAALSRLLLIPEGKQGSVRVPQTAGPVPPSALSHCAGVTSVTVDAGGAASLGEGSPGAEKPDSDNSSAVPSCADLDSGSLFAAAKTVRIGSETITCNCSTYSVYVSPNNQTSSSLEVAFRHGSGTTTTVTVSVSSGYYITGIQQWSAGPVGGPLSPGDTYVWDKKTSDVQFVACSARLASRKINLSPAAGEQQALFYWPGRGFIREENDTTVLKKGSVALDALPIKAGHDFEGYYADEALTKQTIAEDGILATTSYVPTGETTWYAKFTPSMCTVSLNQNGGMGAAPLSLEVPVGGYLDDLGVVVAPPTLVGWDFAGFIDEASQAPLLAITSEGALAHYRVNADKTLLAAWTMEVSLDANGGEGGAVTSMNVLRGAALDYKCYPIPEGSRDYPFRSLFQLDLTGSSDWKPVRAGYRFVGYGDVPDKEEGRVYIEADGTPAVDVVSDAMPGVLYARWVANSYTVNLVDGGQILGRLSAEYDSSIALGDPDERYGYAFAGWDTHEDGTGERYRGSACNLTVEDGEEVTLYAQWTLLTDVEVPIAAASGVDFELGIPDGEIRVAGTNGEPVHEAEGWVRSKMPVPLRIEAIEGEIVEPEGAAAGDAQSFWAQHASFADLSVRVALDAEEDAAAMVAVGAARSGALVVSGGTMLTGEQIPGAFTVPAANSAEALGELGLRYGLSLDRLFADTDEGGAGVDIASLLPDAGDGSFALPASLFKVVYTVGFPEAG